MFTWVEILDCVVYFISLYYVVFWLLVLLEYKDKPKNKLKKNPAVTIIIPAYNESESIVDTIRSVDGLDYPKEKISLIVVDDGSKDDTYRLAKSYCKRLKGFRSVRVMTQKNAGKYKALNNALIYVSTDYMATLDADSFPTRDSLKNIMKEFNDEKIAAVSPIMKVHKPKNYIQVLQWFEYAVNHFYKSMISELNSIHVTPGPLSVYRSDVVKKIGGFREAHKTEDMELAMRLQKKNYTIVQCNDAFVYTKAPYTPKELYHQRIRWNYGTLRNVIDYRKMMFNRKYGDFGMFQLPVILLSGFLGIALLSLLIYNSIKTLKPFYRTLEVYHFNIVRYIMNLEFNVSWLDINARTLWVSTTFFLLALFVVWLSLRLYKEKYSTKRSAVFFIYIIYYFLFLALVWITVFVRYIFKRETNWKKEKGIRIKTGVVSSSKNLART